MTPSGTTPTSFSLVGHTGIETGAVESADASVRHMWARELIELEEAHQSRIWSLPLFSMRTEESA